MNKQELIKKYEEKYETVFGFPVIQLNQILEDLRQLDEPQKPVVQQFVADWYEENKDDFEGNLFRCAHNIPSTFDGAKLNEFERWFLNASIKAFQILVNMHQFGYEVEKEKRYLVKMKGVACPYLNYDTINELWFYNQKIEGIYTQTKHTRKELEEAGFGWVFDCPGIEIKEVEK